MTKCHCLEKSGSLKAAAGDPADRVDGAGRVDGADDADSVNGVTALELGAYELVELGSKSLSKPKSESELESSLWIRRARDSM